MTSGRRPGRGPEHPDAEASVEGNQEAGRTMKSLLLPLNPAKETALGQPGRAVEPLFRVEESDVREGTRSLSPRLLPEVSKSQGPPSEVPGLGLSMSLQEGHVQS